jgi:hypothetical protein
MVRASTRDRLRGPLRRSVCEAVLASVARVKRRSQTATKIFSEDRPAHVACQSRRSCAKIVPLRSRMRGCIVSAVAFPDRDRRIVHRHVSQCEDDLVRTKSHARVFTAAFIGESCLNTICARLGERGERHVECSLILQDLTRRRTRAPRSFSGKAETSRDHAARSPSSGQDGA